MMLNTIQSSLHTVLTIALVYTSNPGLAEPNTIKFGDNTANIKLDRFLPNLIIKFDL